MANVKNNAAAQETRRRLLEAAGEVFAAKGLHATLIRDITERAGVNIAAVNYHFKDKLELYLAALRHAFAAAMSDAIPRMTHGPVAKRLRVFIDAVMRCLLSPNQPAWHSMLFARELGEPTAAFEEMVEQILQPAIEGVSAIVRSALGPGAEPATVNLATCSIMGQCLNYLHERVLITRLYPDLTRPENLDVLVDHVVAFSLGALNGLKRRRPVRSLRRRRSAGR